MRKKNYFIIILSLFLAARAHIALGVQENSAWQTMSKPSLSPEQNKFTIKTVVLDAGHGGHDIGAKGRRHFLKEKDKALAITGKVRDILEKNGITVIMTRDKDEFVTLPGRARFANSSDSDLFISIHINSSLSRSLRGFECYYLSPAVDDNARTLQAMENSSLKLGGLEYAERSASLDRILWDMTLTENRAESAELARRITDSVRGAACVGDRGVKTADFYVLRYSNIPSVLVEVCYISNAFDEARLTGSLFQDKVAGAIASGILIYRDDFEKTKGFTAI